APHVSNSLLRTPERPPSKYGPLAPYLEFSEAQRPIHGRTCEPTGSRGEVEHALRQLLTPVRRGPSRASFSVLVRLPEEARVARRRVCSPPPRRRQSFQPPPLPAELFPLFRALLVRQAPAAKSATPCSLDRRR